MNRGHCLSIHDHIEGYKASSVILTSAVNYTIPFLGKGSVSVPALRWSVTQSREVSMNATFNRSIHLPSPNLVVACHY